MSDGQLTVGPASRPLLERVLHRASAYARLGKWHLWQMFLPIPVAWTLLPRSLALSGLGLSVTALFLLWLAGTTAAALAFDDIEGFRTKLDSATYGTVTAQLRSMRMKPLLLGELTVEQGIRFALGAGIVGLAAGLAAIALTWRPSSVWVLAGVLAVVFVTVQYSYGLRFSYLLFGGAELVILVGFGAAVILPFALLRGFQTGPAVVEAALMGLWMMQVGIFSHSADAGKDRAFGRNSVAARVPEDANRAFIAGTFAVSWALTVAALLLRWLSPWLALALLPAWFLQGRQLQVGVKGRHWLEARILGFKAYALASLALIVTNAISWVG